MIDCSIFNNSKYLGYANTYIDDFLPDKPLNICIVAFATSNQTHDTSYNKYVHVIQKALSKIRHNLTYVNIHQLTSKTTMSACLHISDVIFIGGGNAHRLFSKLKELEIVGIFKKSIRKKLVIAVSAGSAIFSKSINHLSETIPVKPFYTKGLNFLKNKYILPHTDCIFHKNAILTREFRIIQEFGKDNAPVFITHKGSLVKLSPNNYIREITGDKIGLISKNGIEFSQFWYLDEKIDQFHTDVYDFKLIYPDIRYSKDILKYTKTKYTSISLKRTEEEVKNYINKSIQFNQSELGLKMFILDLKSGVVMGGINIKKIPTKTILLGVRLA